MPPLDLFCALFVLLNDAMAGRADADCGTERPMPMDAMVAAERRASLRLGNDCGCCLAGELHSESSSC